MCKSMKEVCQERHLMYVKDGYTISPCDDCIFNKNLDGHWGDCDFIILKSNIKLPRELKDDTIDLFLNSTTNIERMNYLNENWGDKNET